MAGCKSKSKLLESHLPLPPTVDGGLVNGQYIQADYGFGFPVPAKWLFLRLSADQEEDEVARFSDPSREMVVRVSVQINPSEKFSAKAWADSFETDLKNKQFKIEKRDSIQSVKTADSDEWIVAPFHLVDATGNDWMEQGWVLSKDDLLVGIRATLPQDTADTEKGKKLFKTLQGALSQLTWYMPIGPRGLSVERYELQHFNANFCKALESRSAAKTAPFFEDTYPDRAKWNVWFQQYATGDPKTVDLKAELSGLVINGDYASASFTVTRKEKEGTHSGKFERSFRLSKKEGDWKITASLDKN